MNRPTLYIKPLIGISILTVIISYLLSYYDLNPQILTWFAQKSPKVHFIDNFVLQIKSLFGSDSDSHVQQKDLKKLGQNSASKMTIFTNTQLALFDGSRASKPIYLAILGRVYDVRKGEKNYGRGGGYNCFTGKDATRAFVTGDFSPAGLVDNVDGLSESEMLSINDWLAFYEREYPFVGVLAGKYYDQEGKPTQYNKDVENKITHAKEWREKQLKEDEVFPHCNSEWKKGVGGRVWCSNKSGGIHRDWVGVPRKLFDKRTKSYRCACIKNFGASLVTPNVETTRGDLDNPSLREYDECLPDANSCKIS